MDITVAICTWNRADILRITLENLTRLNTPAGAQWELVVVDNNSSDATGEVLEEFLDRLPLRIIHEPVQGLCRARNRAIHEARGEYIFWTDDDVAPEVDWLETTLDAFVANDADFVYGIIRPLWEGEPPEWYDASLNGKFAVLDLGEQPFVATSSEQTFYGANHAARKSCYGEIGGYLEDIGLLADSSGGQDDTELFDRALAADKKIVYEPRSIVWHMIDPKRCHKRYHRRRTWNSRLSYFRTLKLIRPSPTQLFGLPRYLYRIALNDGWSYLKAIVKRDQSAKFHCELKLILFAGACYCAFGDAFRQPLKISQREAILTRSSQPQEKLS